MQQQELLAWYFIIGLIYSLYNGFIRKIDTHGDYMLPVVWFMLWPIAFVSLGVLGITKIVKRIR